MSTTIDELQIEIKTNSTAASKELDILIDSLKKLNKTTGLSETKKQIKGLSTSLKGLSSSTKTVKSSLGGISKFLNSFKSNLVAVYAIFDKASGSFTNYVTNVSDYIETMHLFEVSMGEYSEQALAYSEMVADKLFIDIAEWQKAQATIMSLSVGFGLTKDRAYELSKGLTELAYDLSSFKNVDLEEAFNGLRSAITGEIEPVRNLGFSLEQASLQQIALNHGIKESVSSMTQSQKAILRYTALVEQATNMGMIGDFITTLNSPANAMRILGQQFNQLARSIGSVFLPILVQVMPYLQAMTSILTDMISKLAVLLGFKMPDLVQADTTAGIESTADALDDATASAKKFKSATMGFDELNIISPNTDTGVSTGIGGDLGIDIQEVWNEGMFSKLNDEVAKVKQKILDFFADIRTGIESIPWSDINMQLAVFASRVSRVINEFVNIEGIGETVGDTIGNALNSALYIVWGFVKTLDFGAVGRFIGETISAAVETFNWYKLGDTIGTLLRGALEMAISIAVNIDWGELSKGIVDGIKGALKGAHIPETIAAMLGTYLALDKLGFTDSLEKIFSSMKGKTTIIEKLSAAFPKLKDTFNSIAHPITTVKGLFEKLKASGSLVLGIFKGSGGGLAGTLAVVKSGFTALAGVMSPVLLTIGAIAAVVYTLYANWDLVVEIFRDFIENIGLEEKLNGIKEALGPLMESFSGLHDLFTVIGSFILGVLQVALGILAGLFTAAVNAVEPALRVLTGILDVLGAIGTFIVGVFTGDVAKITESFEKMKEGIGEIFGGLFDFVAGSLKGFVDGVTGWFSSLWTNIKGIFSNSKEEFKEIGVQTTSGLQEGMSGMEEVAQQVSRKIPDVVRNEFDIHSPSGVFEEIGTFLMPGMNNGILATQQIVFNTFSQIITKIKAQFINGFGLKEKSSKYFWDMGQYMLDSLIEGFESMKEDLMSVLQSLVDSVSSAMRGAVSVAESSASAIASCVSEAIASLERLANAQSSMDGMTINVNGGAGVQKFAEGGVIEDGLFTMNYGEIAGRFDNGRSVVANNEMITDGIYQAVLQAMQDASFGNTGADSTPIELQVYLDGKQITASVEKHQKQRGQSIYKGGVLSV